MNEERIKELLKNTGREGIDDLISYMEENGFFTSPCSTRYHLAEEGGLAIHSLNVYENILRIASGLGVINEDRMESFIIVALLHDLGKIGQVWKAELYSEYAERKSDKSKSGSRTEAE